MRKEAQGRIVGLCANPVITTRLGNIKIIIIITTASTAQSIQVGNAWEKMNAPVDASLLVGGGWRRREGVGFFYSRAGRSSIK